LGAFISVEAGRSPDAERTVRALTRRLKSDLVQRQRRAGMRGLLVTVFEALGRDGRPKFNAHVILVMPDADARDRLIESLQRSSVYGGRVHARAVDNWNGLTAYLLKEATSAAWFAAGKSFRRIRGSIPLGNLGGDRVVLSRDLRDVLIATGRIAPFQRSYAKRQRSPPPRAVSHGHSQSHMADLPPEPTVTPGARVHKSKINRVVDLGLRLAGSSRIAMQIADEVRHAGKRGSRSPTSATTTVSPVPSTFPATSPAMNSKGG
jgi:hypothetical protein